MVNGMGNGVSAEGLRSSWGSFRARVMAWAMALWKRVLRLSRRPPKGLRLCESLPLGERRFVAVVEYEKSRFLVGGTPSSLVLLSRLEDAGDRPGGESGGETGGGMEAEADRVDRHIPWNGVPANRVPWRSGPASAKNGRGKC